MRLAIPSAIETQLQVTSLQAPAPLKFKWAQQVFRGKIQIDAILEVQWPGTAKSWEFLVEIKCIVKNLDEIMTQMRRDSCDLIAAPYLSPSQREILKCNQFSYIDLCGNLYLCRVGELMIELPEQPNRFKSGLVADVFDNKSALVIALLLSRGILSRGQIQKQFIYLIKPPQLSKIIQTLLLRGLVTEVNGNELFITDARELIDGLSRSWVEPVSKKMFTSVPEDWEMRLEALPDWRIGAASTMSRRGRIGEGGPLQILARDAQSLIDECGKWAQPCVIPNFAELEILETPSALGYTSYEEGAREASWLQAYIELMRGDARQKSVAYELMTEYFTKGVKR